MVLLSYRMFWPIDLTALASIQMYFVSLHLKLQDVYFYDSSYASRISFDFLPILRTMVSKQWLPAIFIGLSSEEM